MESPVPSNLDAPLSNAYTLLEQIGVSGAHMAEALAWLAPQMGGFGEPDVGLAWAPASSPFIRPKEVVSGAAEREAGGVDAGIRDGQAPGAWAGGDDGNGASEGRDGGGSSTWLGPHLSGMLFPCLRPVPPSPMVCASAHEGGNAGADDASSEGRQGGAAGVGMALWREQQHLRPVEQEMTHSPGRR
eukprot:1142491-Pelagomonas_calceolata.AAC.4